MMADMTIDAGGGKCRSGKLRQVPFEGRHCGPAFKAGGIAMGRTFEFGPALKALVSQEA